MDKFSQKWAVIVPIDEITKGYEFSCDDNPVHITIVGVFASELSGSELESILIELAESHQKMKVSAGEQVKWQNAEGSGIEVVLIEDDGGLRSLVTDLHERLVSLGIVYNEPHHAGDGHTLHSTVQNGRKLQTGQIVEVNQIALIDLFPGGNGYKRRVHSLIDL